jgi:glycosyltransferase involved in cell wall biosynthesis
MAGLTIVHVLGSFQIGGAEMVALNLGASQVVLGHRVHVVSLALGQDGPHAQGFAGAGVVIHRFPKLGVSVDPTLPFRLATLFLRIGADIVHSHNSQPLVYAAPAAFLARVPLVHTKHGADLAKGRAAVLRRCAAKLATRYVAVSRQTAQDAVRGSDVAPHLVEVIENGIDIDVYAPSDEARRILRAELQIPPDALVIGTVGRLAAIKNQPLLVRAAAQALSPNVHLVLVGEGPHRHEVEQAIGKLVQPQSVHLLGQRLDVARLLPGFDVFALTSDSEGLPMVVLEAMACAVPVVSTAVGGIPDVLQEDVTGYLVPKGDERALATRLETLLADANARARIGATAREFCVRHYSWTAMRDRYESLYMALRTGRR